MDTFAEEIFETDFFDFFRGACDFRFEFGSAHFFVGGFRCGDKSVPFFGIIGKHPW